MQSESKREEFRRYLEGAGVLDALTKVLVGLYEEPDKPPDALEYPQKSCATSTFVESAFVTICLILSVGARVSTGVRG